MSERLTIPLILSFSRLGVNVNCSATHGVAEFARIQLGFRSWARFLGIQLQIPSTRLMAKGPSVVTEILGKINAHVSLAPGAVLLSIDLSKDGPQREFFKYGPFGGARVAAKRAGLAPRSKPEIPKPLSNKEYSANLA